MKKDRPTRAADALPDVALVTVELDRASGHVTTHGEFSTPMETWAMLSQATANAAAEIDEVNGVHTADGE